LIELTVVSTHKSITPVADELTVGDLLATLKGNVHVAIDGLKVAYYGS
jgi:hypothetical protein